VLHQQLKGNNNNNNNNNNPMQHVQKSASLNIGLPVDIYDVAVVNSFLLHGLQSFFRA
jgi:hypothetical protein